MLQQSMVEAQHLKGWPGDLYIYILIINAGHIIMCIYIYRLYIYIYKFQSLVHICIYVYI